MEAISKTCLGLISAYLKKFPFLASQIYHIIYFGREVDFLANIGQFLRSMGYAFLQFMNSLFNSFKGEISSSNSTTKICEMCLSMNFVRIFLRHVVEGNLVKYRERGGIWWNLYLDQHLGIEILATCQHHMIVKHLQS